LWFVCQQARNRDINQLHALFVHQGIVTVKRKDIATDKARMEALKLEDGSERKGLAKYVWGGRQVIRKQRSALKPYTFDAAACDLIVIGTPVWAGSPAPAIETFLGKRG
jgi:hypothetical protein